MAKLKNRISCIITFILLVSLLMPLGLIFTANASENGTLPTAATTKVEWEDFQGHTVFGELWETLSFFDFKMGFKVYDGVGEILSISDKGVGYDDYLIDIKLTVSGGTAVGYLICKSPGLIEDEWFSFKDLNALSFSQGTYSLFGLQKWTVDDFYNLGELDLSFLLLGASNDDVQVDIGLSIYPDAEPYVLPQEANWSYWEPESAKISATRTEQLVAENGDAIININLPVIFNVSQDAVCDACVNLKTQHNSLSSAISASENGDTVFMLADDISGPVSVNKNLTIVSNGFSASLTAETGYFIKNISSGFYVTDDLSQMLEITGDFSANGSVVTCKGIDEYTVTSKSGNLEKSVGLDESGGYWIGVNFTVAQNSSLQINTDIITDGFYYVNLGNDAARSYTIYYDADGMESLYSQYIYTITFVPGKGAIALMDGDTSSTLSGLHAWEGSTWCKFKKASVYSCDCPSSFFNEPTYDYTGTPSFYTNRKLREGKYGTGSLIDEWDAAELIDSYVLIVQGDIDGDSVCDAKDAFLAQLHMNDQKYLSGYGLEAADFEEDGVIDIFDYSVILNRSIGISEE
ncbi:MAG: hypothetical protein BWY46_00453 [Firmicutes bacterium ADurb.Bin300]|nr:MAG: hypothetical protein BWY46_00453 [Firmicutes bacterium ADurb.Bin300]